MKHSYLVASIVLILAAIAWLAFRIVLSIVTRD